MSGPVAGPIACAVPGRLSCTVAASGGLSAAKDWPFGRPLRISASHLEDINSRMSEQDWEVLRFVSASRLASGKQLTLGLYLADRDRDPGRARVARKHLKRLAGWRVIDALRGRSVGGTRGGSQALIYGVGVTGARLLARAGLRQKRLGTPGSRYVAHTLACTQVAVDLRLAAARGELELIEVQHEPACWRRFIGGYGLVTLKPDLYVRVALPGSDREYRAMIEVDLATEAAATIHAKASRYLSHYRSGEELRQHGVHPRVIWLAPDERRSQQLAEVIARLPAEARGLFAICRADELISLLITEARS